MKYIQNTPEISTAFFDKNGNAHVIDFAFFAGEVLNFVGKEGLGAMDILKRIEVKKEIDRQKGEAFIALENEQYNLLQSLSDQMRYSVVDFALYAHHDKLKKALNALPEDAQKPAAKAKNKK